MCYSDVRIYRKPTLYAMMTPTNVNFPAIGCFIKYARLDMEVHYVQVKNLFLTEGWHSINVTLLVGIHTYHINLHSAMCYTC